MAEFLNLALQLLQSTSAPVDDAGWNFNWGIHIVSIPLTIALGIMIGWAMRDRKAADDEARRELASRPADPKK